MRRRTKPTVVDIFCGCGGLSQGFIKAGFDVLLGIDCDPSAIDTYNKHHMDRGRMRDINEVDAGWIYREIGQAKIDVLAGGPPCQAFSRAGVAKLRSLGRPVNLDSPLNNLYREFLRLIGEIRPSFFLIENVERMLFVSEGAVKKTIETELEDIYDVTFYRKDAADFGVPQHRVRAIVIGNRLGVKNPSLEPTHGKSASSKKSYITVQEAISDLPHLKAGAGADFMSYPDRKYVSQYARERRVNSFGIFNHVARSHNLRDRKIFGMLKPGESSRNLPPGVNPYRVHIFTDKYKKQRWKGPSSTIMAHLSKDGLMYIHPDRKQSRSLTAREAARLQSFDDDFIFEGYRTNYCKQIGNAVPPLFAYALAKRIKKEL